MSKTWEAGRCTSRSHICPCKALPCIHDVCAELAPICKNQNSIVSSKHLRTAPFLSEASCAERRTRGWVKCIRAIFVFGNEDNAYQTYSCLMLIPALFPARSEVEIQARMNVLQQRLAIVTQQVGPGALSMGSMASMGSMGGMG